MISFQDYLDKKIFFDSEVCKKLKYYVYAYYEDVDSKFPFYIGKGKDNRCFQHLYEEKHNEKTAVIKTILSRQKLPHIVILRHGLEEQEALLTEALAIDLLAALTNLTNRQSGHDSRNFGMKSVSEIVSLYSNTKKISYEDLPDDALVIKIARTYYEGMDRNSLYDMTRCYWKINPHNKTIKYVLSVFEGIVREIYRVAAWLPAGSTIRLHEKDEENCERWEFVGTIADELKHLVGMRIELPSGSQNPCIYTNSLKSKNYTELDE